jgi:hypothetical protein
VISYYTVKLAALVALRLAAAILRLARAELAKVLSSPRHDVLVQFHLDSPQLLSYSLMSDHAQNGGSSVIPKPG